MKDQYFGDVNDYRKYGLLRGLAGDGATRIAVAWMLTPSDGSTDGRFTEYLEQPGDWWMFDPPLYDHLRRALLERGERAVAVFEQSGLLPGARYLADLLPDDIPGREAWFARFWALAGGAELAFFDPDNGLEVPSVGYGRRSSSKFLYWPEVADAARRGLSVLVYQHFPRVRRDPYIEGLAAELAERCEAAEVLAFRTSRVVFLLAPRPEHAERLTAAADDVGGRWAGQIRVTRITQECASS